LQQTNPKAYNAYLQGRYFEGRRNKDDLEKAIGYYDQALQIDPNYARAWVGLSGVHSTQADSGYVPVDEGYAKARKEVQKALELDPSLAEAHALLGWIKRSYDWDWIGADAAYKRALELEPANGNAVRGAASLAAALGRFDEAIKLDHRAIELDPLRISTYNNLGRHYYYAGRWQEAEAALRKALELNPQYPTVHLLLGRIYLAQSESQEALAEMQKEPEPVYGGYGLALAYHAAGKTKEADAALVEYIEKFQNDAAFQIAEIYAFRGETDKAFEWLERAYKQRDGGLAEIKGDPLLRNLERDPRYPAFLKKMKLPLH
jgi:tetratricopeptide (TPR) repeat protein